MYISTRSARRAAAATSALALAAGGAFLASPATAATSADLTYTCQVAGNPQTFHATHTVADTAQYGGKVDVSGTIVVPDALRGFIYGSNTRFVDGTSKVYALAQGAVPITVNETVPRQPVPASGDWTINAAGQVDLAPFTSATPAGSQLQVALQDRKASDNSELPDLEATLQNYDANGTAQGAPLSVPCELTPDGQNLAVGTVTIVKANTESADKLTYKAKSDKLIGKSTVTAPDSGVMPTGDVKFVLKRNGKPMSTATKTLNDSGVASMSWTNVKNGNYKLVTKYLGTSNFNTSGGSATKSVG